jgi:hypothetical protein
MSFGWHGQDLNPSIRILDETVRMIGQAHILFNAPHPLDHAQVDIGHFPRDHQAHWRRVCGYGHELLLQRIGNPTSMYVILAGLSK